jgi:hypothetical protein
MIQRQARSTNGIEAMRSEIGTHLKHRNDQGHENEENHARQNEEQQWFHKLDGE